MAKAKKSELAQAVNPTPDDEYKIKDAADTLMRAEEIRGDVDLHKKATSHLKKKMGHMKKAMSTNDLRMMGKEAAKKEKAEELGE
jgi:hypothetical protein